MPHRLTTLRIHFGFTAVLKFNFPSMQKKCFHLRQIRLIIFGITPFIVIVFKDPNPLFCLLRILSGTI